MAADFPPNLDDGELWLPSDIIADLGVCRRHHRPSAAAALRPGYESELRYIEDLARQLAAIGFLERKCHQYPNLRPQQLEVRPVPRFGSTEPEPFAYDGYRPPANRVPYLPAARLPCYFRSGKPVQPQVDPFGMVRARVLQRQQLDRFIPPVQVRSSGRKSGGTGVFLPRVAFSGDERKKNSMKGGEQQVPNRNAVKQGMTMMMPPQSPSTELGLPHDWTY